MPLAPSPWLITDLTPEVIKALDGSIQTGLGRDGSRAPGLALPAAPSFTVSKTATSVTAIITSANGAESYEFSINGTTWVAGVTIGGLVPATPYGFRGRGINASGTGPSSAVSTVTTNAAVVSNDAWQAILETNFFRADSFDDTGDWTSITNGNYVHTELPVRANSAQTMWGRWTSNGRAIGVTTSSGTLPAWPADTALSFSNGETSLSQRNFSENGQDYLMISPLGTGAIPVGTTVTSAGWSGTVNYLPKWISNEHPTYRNRGKSLCINYNNNSDNGDGVAKSPGIKGFGPQRLGTYFGTEGDSMSGLKKVHLFFMCYFDPDFYTTNQDGTYTFAGVHKLLDMCSGHVEINKFGSPEERAVMLDTPQGLQEYGPNFSLINTNGGGLSYPSQLFLSDNLFTSRDKYNDGRIHYQRIYTTAGKFLRTSNNGAGTDIDEYAQKNPQWFGMELAFDIGTLDNDDGSLEFWLYNDAGTQVGFYEVQGVNRKRIFDHKYNLMTLGGNRLCNGYGACDPNAHSRIYFDDVIINPTRIGPNYFQLLTDFEGPL